MSKRSAVFLLNDILDCIKKIQLYTEGLTFDTFCSDSKTIDAVIRNFEIIGEAANRLPENTKEEYPEADWFRIRGFRNRIVHDYMGIDYQMVWLIIHDYLPGLNSTINTILNRIHP